VFQVPGLDQVTGSPFHLMLFTFPFLEIRFVTALPNSSPVINGEGRRSRFYTGVIDGAGLSSPSQSDKQIPQLVRG
jgi:hypothetical protein